jgi:DNA-3-methyladenine glycosylase
LSRVTGDALRAAFAGPTLEVARSLLGMRLVHEGEPAGPAGAGRRVGRIVEVEAYLGPADRASHARFGETARSRPMYGEAGRAYVYLVYGMYHCLNVVTGPVGVPHAVLIRAVEPLSGIAAIRAARLEAELRSRRSLGPDDAPRIAARLARTPVERLAAGPGLVGAAFGIDRRLTGSDLLDPERPIHLEAGDPAAPAFEILASSRIGIDFAGPPWVAEPWRFTIAGNPSLSR